MSGSAADPPSPDRLAGVFSVSSVRRVDGTVQYIGDPLVPPAAVAEQLRPVFRQQGYDVRLEELGLESAATAAATSNGGTTVVGDLDADDPITPNGSLNARQNQYALIAEPMDTDSGVPWLNIGLLLATIASTLYVGATAWYYIPVAEDPLRVFEAWPFVVAMLGVLGIHELGHYAAARYHGVDVTLPYFIPFPSYLGTMGAVINIRGRIPDRTALFDIGVAGPLAGLVATTIVTVIGLSIDPITVPERVANSDTGVIITFNYPLLFQTLEALVNALGLGTEVGPGESVHPIVFAGWAGMFFTFLNLLPVGQLDGGHIVRSIVGQRQETVAAAVPGALFALAGYLYFTRDPPPIGFGVWGLWVFWGLFATGLAYAGPARPTVDTTLDRRRTLLGVFTFLLGLACFTPVPFEISAI
ncbi:site-2 protease family protein [Haloarcula argentinensis]|uniref:Site-2 protease family protein n=1 Tax=Haloarcula argentinensis TaxID=43776 RepID=A0A830FC35_HALAR|nr:site-2 protease family protein [Haloarcula argentinensis]EMA22419.1 peptidase M50 [Haloarcula argentinensis DSM 12282]MDS0252269.1 site-2 protease family protein [Haloarcula argentinensis]GGM33692.1 site-2 protease family protein [Haloarcula argentinensis]